jgi:hypothetical protein
MINAACHHLLAGWHADLLHMPQIRIPAGFTVPIRNFPDGQYYVVGRRKFRGVPAPAAEILCYALLPSLRISFFKRYLRSSSEKKYMMHHL